MRTITRRTLAISIAIGVFTGALFFWVDYKFLGNIGELQIALQIGDPPEPGLLQENELDGVSTTAVNGADQSGADSTTSTLPSVVSPLAQRPLAIWIWQPGCLTCQFEAPMVAAAADRWSGVVNIVGIGFNGSSSDLNEFISKFDLKFPQLFDSNGELVSQFKFTQTPAWVFKFPDGSEDTVEGEIGKSSLDSWLRDLATTADGITIDTSSEIEVRKAFEQEFGGRVPEMGWTGSFSDCDPGTTSLQHQRAVLSRVRWYRAMAGVDTRVSLDDGLSRFAQEAALMMGANGTLSHDPDGSWQCFSDDGYVGASHSNLFLGVRGPMAIDGYIEDHGADNSSVGHRQWILNNELQKIGTGDVRVANALYVLGDQRESPITPREGSFVMWPPRGFVPRSTIYTRWSVSSRDLPSYARVVVKRLQKVIVDEWIASERSIDLPTLVFEVPRLRGKDPIRVEIFDSSSQLILEYQVVPLD